MDKSPADNSPMREYNKTGIMRIYSSATEDVYNEYDILTGEVVDSTIIQMEMLDFFG